jgi:predicted HTH transcriptional regulator
MNEKVGRHPNQLLRVVVEAGNMPLSIDLINSWDALIHNSKASKERISKEKRDSTTVKAGQWISDVPVNSKDIAMEFNCSRSTATDSLRALLKNGIVKVKLIGRTKWYWKELA